MTRLSLDFTAAVIVLAIGIETPSKAQLAAKDPAPNRAQSTAKVAPLAGTTPTSAVLGSTDFVSQPIGLYGEVLKAAERPAAAQAARTFSTSRIHDAGRAVGHMGNVVLGAEVARASYACGTAARNGNVSTCAGQAADTAVSVGVGAIGETGPVGAAFAGGYALGTATQKVVSAVTGLPTAQDWVTDNVWSKLLPSDKEVMSESEATAAKHARAAIQRRPVAAAAAAAPPKPDVDIASFEAQLNGAVAMAGSRSGDAMRTIDRSIVESNATRQMTRSVQAFDRGIARANRAIANDLAFERQVTASTVAAIKEGQAKGALAAIRERTGDDVSVSEPMSTATYDSLGDRAVVSSASSLRSDVPERLKDSVTRSGAKINCGTSGCDGERVGGASTTVKPGTTTCWSGKGFASVGGQTVEYTNRKNLGTGCTY